MFLGTINCELELDKRHEGLENMRFFLVDPQHEVDWDGSVIAVDTVGAEVGDWVLVALAPFGEKLGLPENLPVEAAVVGVVASISMLSDEEEEEAAAAGSGEPSRDEGRGRRGRDRGEQEDRGRRPRKGGRRRSREEAGASSQGGRGSGDRGDGGGRSRERREPEAPSGDREPDKEQPERESPPAAAGSGDKGRKGGGERVGEEGMTIVWEGSEPEPSGSPAKGKPPRRRR